MSFALIIIHLQGETVVAAAVAVANTRVRCLSFENEEMRKSLARARDFHSDSAAAIASTDFKMMTLEAAGAWRTLGCSNCCCCCCFCIDAEIHWGITIFLLLLFHLSSFLLVCVWVGALHQQQPAGELNDEEEEEEGES
jgi:hypothetical protein